MKKNILFCIFACLLLWSFAQAQSIKASSHQGAAMQQLRVSDNGRFLVHEDGKPFFYLGDTAWELFHRLNMEEAGYYMENRKAKGFTVIQATILAELDGLHTPNAFNHTPLQNDDPTKPNEAYFKDVDRFLELAADKGLYVGLLPTWGDKVFKNKWGVGPEVFNRQNARTYGQFLGERYRNQRNIIWILGGDRTPRDSGDVEIWLAMAEGIAAAAGGNDKTLMSFHPQPKADGGSSTWFHQDAWLDFNMLQTGHCTNGTNYLKVAHDYALQPTKPVMDAEPLYEDHPICFDLKKNGYSKADDIRKLAYWQVFAGAFGHTYGCHPVWQMYAAGREPVNAPQRTWKEALELPGATQMGYVKKLILSKPFLTRIPDQSLILGENPQDSSYCSATRDQNGSYAFIYTPTGKTLKVNTSKLRGKTLSAQWYNPRSGTYGGLKKIQKEQQMTFVPPDSGEAKDWVLILSGDLS